MPIDKKVIEFIAEAPKQEQYSVNPVEDAVQAFAGLFDRLQEISKEVKQTLDSSEKFANENKDFVKQMKGVEWTAEERRKLSVPTGPNLPPQFLPTGKPAGPKVSGAPPVGTPPPNPNAIPPATTGLQALLKQWNLSGAQVAQFGKSLALGRTAMAGLTASMNPLLKAIGLAAIGFIVISKVMNEYHEAIKKAIASVGAFSMDTNYAKARGKIMEMEDKMRSGQRLGGDVASYIDIQNEAARSSREIFRDLTAAFLPVATMLVYVGVGLLKLVKLITGALAGIMELIEVGTEGLLKILSFIPGVGSFFGKMYDWMRKDDKPQATMEERIDKLFGPAELEFDVEAIKKNVKKGTATKAAPSKPNTSSSPAYQPHIPTGPRF